MSQDIHEKLARLERENQVLREQLALIEHIDDALEEAILHKWPVSRTMASILEPARERLGARALLVRTFDEQQQRVDFAVPALDEFALMPLDLWAETIATQGTLCEPLEVASGSPGRWVLGYRLDVTDVYLGSVILIIHDGPQHASELEQRARSLQLWSEQVDNYLASIAQSRRKHQALRELSDALRSPILDEGINRALRLLRRYVPYEDIALAICYEEHLERSTINYRVVAQETWVSSMSTATAEQGARQDMIIDFIRGQEDALIDHFNLTTSRQVAPILAADGVAAVGRVSVGLEDDQELSPFARDLLDRFADYIRLRVVDFNKEWKRLSHNFPHNVARRLLQEERYFDRYLSAREREVAIMFCDISGFTRLSEQILKEPALIGRLIDTWGNKVVEFIWDTGGVFDKMVGDCIIGMWGPPFFEMDPKEAARAALDAATLIRDYTISLKQHPDLPQLADMEGPVGVATGLNFCPLFVGTFGPDENYTGFSSGMNNTARLQGVAGCNEILCMESFVEVFAEDAQFSELRQAHVKNVLEPLRYRHALDR